MSNPNLFKVWSPDGSEMVETSRANARDLTTHAGWLNSPPHVIEKIVVVEVPAPAAKTETPAPVAAPAAEPVVEEAPVVEDDAEAGDEDDAAEAPAVRKTEEDFADLTERDDVVAYLAATFPEYKPHHLTRRETLIKKAIELANA